MVEQVKIAITLEDDSLVIMSFITDDHISVKREANEININNEIQKSNFNAKSWRIIQDEDFIFMDRNFRNAWKDVGNKIDIDMPKAREIHKEKLRNARNDLLFNLDIEYMKADENGDEKKKKEIGTKKQILRDITNHPSIEAAQNLDELKSVWFDIL